MKGLVLSVISGAVFLLFTDICLAQKYDLIVTTNGDSIACHTDSITASAYPGQLPRNSVYAGIGTLTYARTFLGNPIGITLAGGILYIDAPGILLESTLLVGGPRHWFEPGLMAYYIFNTGTPPEENNSLAGISIRMGYRYQGPRGFLFRAAPLVAIVDEGFVILPGLSLGYSF